MVESDELSALETALYRQLLSASPQRAAQLAAEVEASVARVHAALRHLTEFGLVGADGSGGFVAVSPMLAEASVLGAEDLELAARRSILEVRRNTIRRLVPDWNTAYEATAPTNTVDVVVDRQKIGNVLMHFADRCREELLSVSPGQLSKSRLDSRTRLANLYSLRRGIMIRGLYQSSAIRDRFTLSYLGELAEHGAHIRFAGAVPGRCLVVDRDVALLPIPGRRADDQGLAIVREPNVITWVVATFEQLWTEAMPLDEAIAAGNDDTQLDRTRSAVLRLMAEGEKDEAIARRLSISVRTCRRHISDYMAHIGATSRFQAGVIAARVGHVDPPQR